jgi:hypothetical protein
MVAFELCGTTVRPSKRSVAAVGAEDCWGWGDDSDPPK